MEIVERILDDTVIMDLKGRFEFRVVGEFKCKIEQLTETVYRHVVLNMGETSYLDSSALGILLYAQQILTAHEKTVSILHPQPHSQAILVLANIHSVIPIHQRENNDQPVREMNETGAAAESCR